MSPDRLRELTAAARDLERVASRVQRLRPVVEVALVPAPDARGPIVEVEIIPVRELRRLGHLKTLAEIHAVPRAVPKPSTKLDRAIAKKAARLEDAKQLRAWALAVKTRDQFKCRKTGERLRRTMELDPLRAECHHLVSREDRSVRYDVRNGITVSLLSHMAIERHEYRIEGTVFFRKHGALYIDATFPVVFVRL